MSSAIDNPPWIWPDGRIFRYFQVWISRSWVGQSRWFWDEVLHLYLLICIFTISRHKWTLPVVHSNSGNLASIRNRWYRTDSMSSSRVTSFIVSGIRYSCNVGQVTVLAPSNLRNKKSPAYRRRSKSRPGSAFRFQQQRIVLLAMEISRIESHALDGNRLFRFIFPLPLKESVKNAFRFANPWHRAH
jgi:hypothetical protein